jgi:hypothetical protein
MEQAITIGLDIGKHGIVVVFRSRVPARRA